jgi:hypothetical protein
MQINKRVRTRKGRQRREEEREEDEQYLCMSLL